MFVTWLYVAHKAGNDQTQDKERKRPKSMALNVEKNQADISPYCNM